MKIDIVKNRTWNVAFIGLAFVGYVFVAGTLLPAPQAWSQQTTASAAGKSAAALDRTALPISEPTIAPIVIPVRIPFKSPMAFEN